MAYIYRLPSGLWRAQIARRGHARQSSTFGTKKAAELWATQVEAEILASNRGEIPRKTVAQALQRYAEEVSPTKRGEKWERNRLHAYLSEPWAQRWLTQLTPADLGAWRDLRLQGVSPATVKRDFILLSAVFRKCVREWRWLQSNPVAMLDLPGDSPPRKRRTTWREIRAICRALGYPGPSKSAEVARAYLIAQRTGMRAGEIMSLKPADVDLTRRVARLRMTKNGDARDVPMTPAAARLFQGWTGWTVGNASRDELFRKACRRCGIEDLRFHDSRADALTRLARKLSVMDLAKVSGHRDVNLLTRVYYRVTPDEIADKLR